MHKSKKFKLGELPIKNRNIVSCIFSSFIGILTVLILTFVMSILINKSPTIYGSINIIFSITVLIGALLTGFIAAKKCSFKGIIAGLVSSIPFLCIILILMLVFSNGNIAIKSLIIFGGIVISSVIGGILSANTKRRK